MADKELRAALGVSITHIIDDATLDLIYEKLMEMDDPGKIPVTAKFIFSVDEDAILEVEVDVKGNFQIGRRKLRLKSDGKQLRLWDTKTKAAPPEPPPLSKAEIATALATPGKKKRKKAPAKKAAAAPKKRPARRPKPKLTVEERKAEIDKNNIALYRAGAITDEQAEAAGLDLDAINGTGPLGGDEEMDLAEKFGGTIGGDLSPEEQAELDDLVDA